MPSSKSRQVVSSNKDSASDSLPYLSITQVNQVLNTCLEEAFPSLLFQGEISELTRAASGHLYFRVKDENSQIDAVMWRGNASGLRFDPKPGVQVLCRSRPNVYHRSGRLQLIVSRMLPAGEGALQIKFQELQSKLEKEGLFLDDRKRALPFFPACVGIVTSRTGAAIHDMMVKIKERMPGTRVILFDARVQGEGSAAEIVQGIERLNQEREVEVIIVGRGGGSLEDLWSFNEEVVVRAIFASRIPIVSAVGHEVDITLSDLVADARAPTPTAAAELVVPHRKELGEKVRALEQRLHDLDYWFYPLVQEFEELSLRLGDAAQRMRREYQLQLERAFARLASIHPKRLLDLFESKLTGFEQKLGYSGRRLLTDLAGRIEMIEIRLTRSITPQKYREMLRRVDHLEITLFNLVSQRLVSHKELITQLSRRLLVGSPQSVLDRGYAIVELGDVLIRSANQVEQGQRLTISLSQGQIVGDVRKIRESHRFSGRK